MDNAARRAPAGRRGEMRARGVARSPASSGAVLEPFRTATSACRNQPQDHGRRYAFLRCRGAAAPLPGTPCSPRDTDVCTPVATQHCLVQLPCEPKQRPMLLFSSCCSSFVKYHGLLRVVARRCCTGRGRHSAPHRPLSMLNTLPLTYWRWQPPAGMSHPLACCTP